MNATLEQVVDTTKNYLLGSAKHLKGLPKIRSVNDAVQFATEAKNRGMTYAKKTVALLKKGAAEYQAQYGDWIKTKKGEWIKMGAKSPVATKKRSTVKRSKRPTVMRHTAKKVEAQERPVTM